MAGYKTRPLNKEEFEEMVELFIKGGYEYAERKGDKIFKRVARPNEQMAMLVITQANLGVRIGDILQIRLVDIVQDGKKRKIDIIEQKTKKPREFLVSNELYNLLLEYCMEKGIRKTARIFPMTVRNAQNHIKYASEWLGLKDVSTHSFRKYYATTYYEATGDILEVKRRLQHAKIETTLRYIGYNEKKDLEMVEKCTYIPKIAYK